MSDTTARLDAIQARLDAATPGAITITPSDVSFLFDLARKQQAVIDAVKAGALREAARGITTNDPLDYWSQHLPEGLGWQEAASRWLMAHAAALESKP
jgi:hypothetical protein